MQLRTIITATRWFRKFRTIFFIYKRFITRIYQVLLILNSTTDTEVRRELENFLHQRNVSKPRNGIANLTNLINFNYFNYSQLFPKYIDRYENILRWIMTNLLHFDVSYMPLAYYGMDLSIAPGDASISRERDDDDGTIDKSTHSGFLDIGG